MERWRFAAVVALVDERKKRGNGHRGFRFAFIGLPLSFSSLFRFSFVNKRSRSHTRSRIYRYTIAHSHTWFDLLGNFCVFFMFWMKRRSAILKPHQFRRSTKENRFFFFRFTVAINSFACERFAFWAPSSSPSSLSFFLLFHLRANIICLRFVTHTHSQRQFSRFECSESRVFYSSIALFFLSLLPSFFFCCFCGR